MRNQKGEVVTAVMIAMMVGMMIFGGMHLMHRDHGEHRSTGDHPHHEQGHDHREKGQQHEHRGDAGKASESGADEMDDNK